SGAGCARWACPSARTSISSCSSTAAAHTKSSMPSTSRSRCCGPNPPPSRKRTSGSWPAMMPELNVIAAIVGRDLLKFLRDPGRLVVALVFPLLMIFLLGGTLQLNLGRTAGFNFIGFTFTGFLGMTLFQSTAQGLTSLMDDRQNDFAQEVFVSPISRYSIVFGKILGETAVAIVQVLPMVVFAIALQVPLSPARLALLAPVALLSCFMGG